MPNSARSLLHAISDKKPKIAACALHIDLITFNCRFDAGLMRHAQRKGLADRIAVLEGPRNWKTRLDCSKHCSEFLLVLQSPVWFCFEVSFHHHRTELGRRP